MRWQFDYERMRAHRDSALEGACIHWEIAISTASARRTSALRIGAVLWSTCSPAAPMPGPPPADGLSRLATVDEAYDASWDRAVAAVRPLAARAAEEREPEGPGDRPGAAPRDWIA